MAKNTQEAEVIVTMNGEAAKKTLAEITQKYQDLQKAALDAYKAGDDALGKKLDAEAQKLMKDIEITRRETKKFADVMNNINGATLKELNSAAKQLKGEINKLTPGTQAFIDKSKQLQQVNTRITQLRGSFKGLVEEEKQATFSLKGLADGFNKYFGMVTAGVAAVTGVSMAFRKAAQDAAALDDTYSDVMKTTGLLHDEVKELDEELMKIDTRTSREQLLLLARDAGKLGIQGKENILGFVRAADQIQVALGEDLGEGAIKNLGKIADVFGLTKEMGIEKSLLSIASAINALGQDSTASEAYLVDFTQRLAGVGAMAGLSVQDILGFASGLDQSAMKVEMAATAFQKFLMSMYEEPAKFAKYAGMEVEAFSELLKTNANEAISSVMKAMNGQDGFAAMVPIFNEMGLDGARAVGVLSSMTKNLDAVTQAQALANVEFSKATSVTEEYNTKNNNLQAQLEKARKEFHNASIELGQSLNPVMLKSTKATTYLIKAFVNYGKEIRNAAIAVAALTVAIKLKTIAQGLANVASKASIALTKTKVVVTNLLKLGYFKLTKQTAAAAVAQAALNGAMNASVFGLIATAVVGLTVAITHWVKKSREAAEVTDYLAEADKRASEEYGEQAGKVRTLTAIMENNNISLRERKKALDELKKIVPGYHGDLTEEGRLINSNKEAIDAYCNSLRQQLRLEARKEQLMEIEKQIAALEDQKANAQERQFKALEESGGDTTEIKETHSFWKGQQFTYTSYGQAKKDEDDLQKQIDELEEQAEKLGARTAQLTKEIEENNRSVEIEEEKKTNSILTKAQFDYLEERQDKLTKKEKKMIEAGYASLSEEESKALKARYDKLMKAGQNLEDKQYQQDVKNLERRQREEQNILNDKFFNQEITAEEHEKQLRDITMKYLLEKRKLAEDNNKDTSSIDEAIIKERMKVRKEDYDIALKQLKDSQKEEEMALMESRSAGKMTQEEYESQLLEIKNDYILKRMQLAGKSGQDETAIMQEWLDMQVETTKEAMEKMEKLKEDAKNVIAGLDPSSARAMELEEQLKQLDELHNAKLLSEQQYEEAVKKLRKKYSDEDLDEKLGNVKNYIQQVNTLFSEASNFVTALKEAESAKLEAQYQADLTAAGDNAEKREQIEAEYEQKQLDLKKKYADTEMAINIAKTVASGAVAAIKAYAEGGPYLGIVLAALIAATTAAEVATIVAQRNAIKNTSVSSSGSSSAPKTGQRKVTGYAEGGYTEDHTTLTTVGERGTEWVAPHWMLQKDPVTFANLERYRKAGSHGQSGSMKRGFADGGYTNASYGQSAMAAQATPEVDWQAMRDFNEIMRYCAENGLFVKYGDILIAKEKLNNFKSQTSR
ncbi:MAG: phage tail tape measure protein [Bacteroidales bacterium]|nr:phage tail tape measure protein [Bacteroidales bacterium]